MEPKLQATLGGALFGLPWLVWWDVLTKGAAGVSMICGAIIGAHAVWKIIRDKK